MKSVDYNKILELAKEYMAKPMPLFRVDERGFQVGDTIEPQGDYQERMGEEQQRIEWSLTRTRRIGGGVQRKNCLFLFDDIKNALIFWYKKKGKANLYRLSVQDEIIHRGDMNYLDLLNEIARNTKEDDDQHILDTYSKRYWDHNFATASPCYELLFPKAIVEEVVVEGNSKEAKMLCCEIRDKVYVQLTKLYKSLVNMYY